MSGIFTIVIWGSDQIEYPYDFTTNLHLRYGRLPPPQSSSTFPPPSPRVPVIWPRYVHVLRPRVRPGYSVHTPMASSTSRMVTCRFATSGGAATAMVLGDNASVPFGAHLHTIGASSPILFSLHHSSRADPENNDVFPAPAPNVPSPAPTSSHPRRSVVLRAHSSDARPTAQLIRSSISSSHTHRTQELGLWSPPVAYHAEAAGNSHASLFSDLKSKLCAFWEEFNHD